MTDRVKQLLEAAFAINPAPLKPSSALVVVAPPTLAELTAKAQQSHEAVEQGLLNAVVRGIDAGKALSEIKKQLPHGHFEDHIAQHFTFAMTTAQKYMRLARREPELRQLIATKASPGAHLTMREALKFLETLRPKKKRKPKA